MTFFFPHIRKLLITFCLLLIGIIPAHAAERILNYDVLAILEKDASLLITETITVNARNEEIRHGITRIFPIMQKQDKYGLKHYSFDLVSVKRNGANTPYLKTDQGYMAGLAIGHSDFLISEGIHTYEITYRTKGHVRFLQDHDEIYFNAIGFDNIFPVDKASFTLKLPENKEPILAKVYTGRAGSTETDYQQTGPASFKSTRILSPGEGMTVVIGWEKNLISKPSLTMDDWIGANRNFVLTFLVIVIALLLFAAWFFFYRRPSMAVFPLFSPPEGLSPALASWVKNKDFSPSFFHSDLIWTAVNGFSYLDLSNPQNVIINKVPAKEDTKPSEKDAENEANQQNPYRKNTWEANFCEKVCHVLFGETTSINLFQEKKAGRLLAAVDALKTFYKDKTSPLTTTALLPGFLIFLLGIGIFYWLMDKFFHPGLDMGFSALEMLYIHGSIFALVFLSAALAIKSLKLFRYENPTVRYGVPIMEGLFALGIFCVEIWLLDEDWFFIIAYTLLVFLPLGFMTAFHTKFTKKGWKIKQQVQGLEMYISTAEKERLAVLNAPADTVKKYEELLPYAIALDCADAWQKRFAPLLSDLKYPPSWVSVPSSAMLLASYQELTQRIITDSSATEAIFAAVNASAKRANKKATSKMNEGSSGSSSGSAGGGSGGGGVGGW